MDPSEERHNPRIHPASYNLTKSPIPETTYLRQHKLFGTFDRSHITHLRTLLAASHISFLRGASNAEITTVLSTEILGLVVRYAGPLNLLQSFLRTIEISPAVRQLSLLQYETLVPRNATSGLQNLHNNID
jgi:hypothetical protein